MKVSCVLNSQAALGEGPVWCSVSKSLFWVDILDRKTHRFDPASGNDISVSVPSCIGSLALTESDRLIVALQHELCWLDMQTSECTPFLSLDEPPGNRMNDGKCDAATRLFSDAMR